MAVHIEKGDNIKVYRRLRISVVVGWPSGYERLKKIAPKSDWPLYRALGLILTPKRCDSS